MKFAIMATNQLTLQAKGKNHKALTVLIHLVCILIIFVLPEVLITLTRRGSSVPFSIAPYLKSLIWICVFYISYYLTADPTSGRKADVVKYTVQNLILIIVAAWAMYYIWQHFRPEFKPDVVKQMAQSFKPKPHHGPGGWFMARECVVTILAIGLALILRTLEKIRLMEKKQLDYQEREREAELNQLKAQLNPHFLFNTLNSIYALVDISPEKARDSIHRLSRMLRYMLYENHSTVTLGDEVRFLESYVELMRLRLPASIPANVSFDMANCEEKPIVPLLFVNIIENAFKHGTRASSPGPISISLTVKDNVVTCHTSNAFDRTPAAEAGSGIGLANLRRRLQLQYPDRHELTVDMDTQYNVTLKIDISTPPEMSLIKSLSHNKPSAK